MRAGSGTSGPPSARASRRNRNASGDATTAAPAAALSTVRRLIAIDQLSHRNDTRQRSEKRLTSSIDSRRQTLEIRALRFPQPIPKEPPMAFELPPLPFAKNAL